MSQYHTVNDVDIDIDQEHKEVDIYVTSDDLGGIYLIMPFAQVERLVKRLEELKKQ